MSLLAIDLSHDHVLIVLDNSFQRISNIWPHLCEQLIQILNTNKHNETGQSAQYAHINQVVKFVLCTCISAKCIKV